MTNPLWRWRAVDLAASIRRGDISCREVTASVLARIDEVNPAVNALVDVMADDALRSADRADQTLAEGGAVGPLHGVPVTVKVNVDVKGRATTDGVVSFADNIAEADSPLVAHLREAGAIIVGRSNTPAFSLRWFTDNDLHGRTLNPFDAAVTPGGSSGGAAVALALGMGPVAHGNDYGGSIRYPAWACGVVGLRTTVGRVAAYKGSAAQERIVSNQLMAVQGPLTRAVADARLALAVMARASELDPNWVAAPLEHPDTEHAHRVAVFKHHAAFDADPTVVAALEQAQRWLQAAGFEVDEVAPPHFEEACALWRCLVYDDLRRAVLPAVEALGDDAVRASLRFSLEPQPDADRDTYLDALARRFTIARDWSRFFSRYPVLLMPVSWQRQCPIDADTVSVTRMQELIAAQSPLLATAMLGLPGLALPTGLADGLPVGVQVVAGRFREDRCLRVGEVLERAAGFSALDRLAAAGA